MDLQTLQQKMRSAHNAAMAATDPNEAARHRQAASRFKQAIIQLQNQPQQQPAQPAGPPQGGSIADSLGQGVSFGFSDELAGAGGAAVNSLMNLFGKGTGESFGDAYKGIRDAARYNQAAFSGAQSRHSLGRRNGGRATHWRCGRGACGSF